MAFDLNELFISMLRNGPVASRFGRWQDPGSTESRLISRPSVQEAVAGAVAIPCLGNEAWSRGSQL